MRFVALSVDVIGARSVRELVLRISDGVRMVGWRALWIFPSWAVRRNFTVMVKDLRRIPPLPDSDDVRCVLLNEADIARAVEIEPTMTEEEIRHRWEEGQECLVGWIGDTPAGLHWDTMRSLYLSFLGKTLRLAAGDSYAGHGYTHPRFRGRGVHPRLSLTAMHRARDRGARRSISLTAVWNRAAHHIGFDKLERKVAGSIGYWTLGCGRRYTTTGDVRLESDGSFHVLLCRDP